eukprot:GFUD01039219.1.p1 GENE.GFUD01039219.1~~GFUD01039219.1.p1  ORF type:complete len:179 (+),score=42.17 GFUD01039219.1:81-617(+)
MENMRMVAMISLGLLWVLLVVLGTHAITITVKDENEGNQEALHQLVEAKVDALGGAHPPMHNLTSSCSCDKLLLSSLGPAAISQPKVMGIYTRSWTSYNQHRSYRMNYGADYRLYHLPTSGWLVSYKRGANIGYVHNPDISQTCPYLIQSGWLYYNSVHGVWLHDTTLVLRCIQKTEE